MDSQGGALHFDSDVDNRKFLAKILASEQRVDLFAKNVIKSTEQIDIAFANLGSTLESGKLGRGLDSVQAKITNLQTSTVQGNLNLANSYNSLGNQISNGRYGRSLAEMGRVAVNGNNAAKKSFKEVAQAATESGNEISSVFSGLTGVIAGFLSVQAARGFVDSVVKIRSEFENLDVAFTTILKSKERADKLMADVISFAATTPFGLTEVAKSTKQLLAYGVAAEDVRDELTTLGNIAAGVSQPIGEVAYLYGTLKTQGRAYAMDIRQFTGRGIPIIEELAKVLGVAKDQVMGLVEEGKVGFPEVQKAFQNMTGSGGAFFDLMQKQSLTTGGRISNLRDQIDLMFNSFGEANSGIINGGITGLQYLVANYEQVIGLLGTLIATYGAYRAALVLTAAIEANMWGTKMIHNGARMVAVTVELTGAQTLQAISAGIAAKAQAALNTVMAINPYVAIATAIIGLASAMYFLRDSTTAQEKAQKALNDEYQDYRKHVDSIRTRVRDLNNTLSDKASTDLQQEKAYQELQAIYPAVLANMSRENYLKLEATEAQKRFNAENDKADLANIETRYGNANKRVAELTAKLKELTNYNSQGGRGGITLAVESLRKELEAAQIMAKGLGDSLRNETEELKYSNLSNKEKLDYLQKQKDELVKQRDAMQQLNKLSGNLNTIFTNYNLGNLTNQIDNLTNKMETLKSTIAGKPTVRTVRDIDKNIDEVKDKQKGSSNRSQFDAFEAEIKKLEAERTKITGKLTKADNKAANERKRFLDNLAEQEQKSIAKTLSDNEEAIQNIVNKYDEQRKRAKELGLGAGVVARIDRMEKRETGALRYEQDTDALLKEINRQKDIYKDYEQYKTEVSADAARTRYGKELKSFGDFGSYLRSEIEKLYTTEAANGDLTGKEQERLTKLLEVQKDFSTEQREIENKRYADALLSAQSLEENITAIKIKYANKAISLGKDATNARKGELMRQRDAEINGAIDEANRKAEIYKQLNGDVIQLTRERAKSEIEVIENLIKTAKDLSPEVLATLQTQLAYAKQVVAVGSNPAYVAELKKQKAAIEERIRSEKLSNEMLAEYKKQLEEINGALKDQTSLAKKAASISSGISDVAGSFKELAGSLEETNPELAYTLNSLGDIAKVGADAVGAFASFASGDIIGGITKTISAVAGLFSISSRVKKMNDAARKEMQDFYDKAKAGEVEYQALLRDRERKLLEINAIGLSGIEDQSRALQKQKNQVDAAYQDTLRQLQSQSQGQITGSTYKHGTWLRKAETKYSYASLAGMDYDQLEQLFTQGKLTEGAEKLFEELRRLKEEGADVAQALKDAAEAAAELATGTTIQNLSNNIIESLRAGKNGLSNVMDDYTAIIRDALLSTFKSDVVDVEMKAFYDRLAKLASSNGELTDEEIKQAQDDYIETRKRIEEAFKLREKVTGVSLTDGSANESGLTASIKSLTEDTGVALEGLIRGMFDIIKRNANTNTQNSITLTQQNEYLKQLVRVQIETRDYAANIAINTASQVENMGTMLIKLDSIITNTKPPKTGRDTGTEEV